MSHPPSTPAKVPASAATYTPATQDAELRSQINTLLLREGHATKIQERFLHALDAHSSNWPSAIQSHALALLRSGEVSTFPALVRRVLEDVQRETAAAATSASTQEGVNGASKPAGANGTTTGADGATSLVVPTTVIDSVLKVVRDSLETLCEIEPGESAGG